MRGIVQLDPGEAVLVPLEVGVGVVEHRRADRPRRAEVVRGAFDGRRSTGRPRASERITVRAGTRSTTGSIVAVPTVRYGWAPEP